MEERVAFLALAHTVRRQSLGFVWSAVLNGKSAPAPYLIDNRRTLDVAEISVSNKAMVHDCGDLLEART